MKIYKKRAINGSFCEVILYLIEYMILAYSKNFFINTNVGYWYSVIFF